MNKKVKNATPLSYDGIQFKSILEVDTYKRLQEEGYVPEYEKHTYEVWEGRRFSVPCYDFHNNRKLHKNKWELNTYKAQSIKYTPDFTFYAGDTFIVVEVKGFANDRYPYVKKLFRTWLDDNMPESMFFEIHNRRQLDSAIEIIKQQSNLRNNV